MLPLNLFYVTLCCLKILFMLFYVTCMNLEFTMCCFMLNEFVICWVCWVIKHFDYMDMIYVIGMDCCIMFTKVWVIDFV